MRFAKLWPVVVSLLAVVGAFGYAVTLADEVDPPPGTSPKQPRQASISDYSATRRVGLDEASVGPRDTIINTGGPGRIQFTAIVEARHGGKMRGVSKGYEQMFLRVEVYDPKDQKRERPIFVKQTDPMNFAHGQGKSMDRKDRVELDLGPFVPSSKPFTVHVYLMRGGTRGQVPVASARTLNFTSALTGKVIVR